MKHFPQRTLATVLAVLMCVGMLAACAPDKNPIDSPVTTDPSVSADVTTEPAGTESTRITPNLPAADFKEYEFTVLTRGGQTGTWASRDIYAEGITGEVINDAVYRRNNKIEQIYNFKIVEIGSDSAHTMAKTSIMAQQDEYDMVCIRLKDHITGLITQGLLLDLNEIALLDLSQPYYDQSAMETLSLGNKLFAVTGDLLIMDNDATRCTVFNADLFEKLQLADQVGGTLYQAVKDGRWTLDMLELCSQAAVSDLNGDQVMTYQDDQWGQANEVFNTFGFLNAGGIFTFEKDENDIPVFQANNERCISALQRIIPMMNAEYTLFYSDGNEVLPNFRDGRILFHNAQIATFSTHYRDMDDAFGIIPLPKHSEEQEEYISPLTAYGSNCISIPITASDVDRTATIIEALSCESMYTLTPAYFENTLKGRILRDEESTVMLDYILANPVFELAYMWNWGGVYGQLTRATTANNSNVASMLKSLEKTAAKAVEYTMKTVSD